MNNDNASRPEDDKAFDQELKALYKASLLDENFQQQVAENLRSLPTDIQSRLRTSEQAMLDEVSLTTERQAKLLAATPACQRSESLIKRLAAGLRQWLVPPALALPTTLVAGVLLGLFVPALLQTQLPDDTFRGDPAPGSGEVVSGSESAKPGEITDAVRQQPQQWLVLITELLRQGKIAQAREELQAFELLHPDYQPPG